ncbi:hypothetical protein LEP1GSC186_0170 [Leptospira noguchii serovar Autumnalis str. ZUN142]|uniref:Uncharacterized protein n=1 Tax=Leptospira noguchii serovar Autumnalis str. ZUN142 TaxID=1085540 RepID=M6UCU1_9LEPT|nr:hypothetical protein LEP1GSC186_0170 [Leptospira noguchii serovar Autumnalis str. ZUN142]
MRSGELESIHVPSEEDEAVRDHLRSRDSLRLDLGRNRQRLMKFLSTQLSIGRQVITNG